MATLLYGAGLRLMGCCRLRVNLEKPLDTEISGIAWRHSSDYLAVLNVRSRIGIWPWELLMALAGHRVPHSNFSLSVYDITDELLMTRSNFMNYLPQVTEAHYVREFIVSNRFDDGTEKYIYISQWFKGPVFEPLKDPKFFKKFFVEAGTLAWPNGVDIAPEGFVRCARIVEERA